MSDHNMRQLLDSIKSTDSGGKSYWTSRELCKAFGYSSYQKFSDLIIRSIAKAKECGYADHDLFNCKGEMVEIGSGAMREKENYQLTNIACRFITEYADRRKKQTETARCYFSEDNDGADCDVNGHTSLSFEEKESIKARNRDYWEQMTMKASEGYKRKMKRLCLPDTDEEKTLLRDFRRDDSFLGKPASHHIIYKLGDPLISNDRKRAYEFLIEYDIYEPIVGIYYGCKGLTLEGNHDQQIEKFIQEWEALCNEMARVLQIAFPGKQFAPRFKLTNNANNNTYWPFWITLNEEEDIVGFAARALHIIKKIYESRLHLSEISNIKSLGVINNKEKEPETFLREQTTFVTKTAFSESAYRALLKKMGNEPNPNRDLFEELINALLAKGMLRTVEIYEKAYGINFSGTDFAYLMVVFFNYLKENKTYKASERRLIPWEAITNVFLNMEDKDFGKDTLKNSFNAYNKKRDENDPTHKKRLSQAKEVLLNLLPHLLT